VLQDILYNAKIHPRKKLSTFKEDERTRLYRSVKETLREMAELGGRDTEKNLFGKSGGYATKAGKNSINKPCPVCGGTIIKENYLGGSIYYCNGCQTI
jgi:formamidopyrimidine-DNA glycosylase